MKLLGTIAIFSKWYTVCSVKWFIWSMTCNHTKPTYIVFKLNVNKANLRDLIAATSLVISHWIQIVNFSTCVTVKFDGWPRKTIWHFFYTTPSFVHHFISIGEFKLDLQSRNAQFGWKLVIFDPVWSWNLMDDLGKQQGTSSKLHQVLCIISKPSVKSNLSYSPEMLKSGNWWLFVPLDLEIWWMTLKNNRTPFLYYIKVCASFQSHGWIQSRVTVRKHSIRVKMSNFLSCVTLKFNNDLEKQ